MREIVLGVGLPRSGTTSLAAALEILGYNTLHFCPITHKETAAEFITEAWFVQTEKTYDAYVSSSLLAKPQVWAAVPHDFKWVVLTKSWDDVRWSLENLGEDPDEYEHWTEDMAQLIPTLRECLFYEDRGHLLRYNIADGWEPLCEFLERDVPEVDFPHINKGPDNYEI